MVVNDRPLKRMKRRIFADLYDFFSFPEAAEAEKAVEGQQPFRDSVRTFLERHAQLTLTPSVLPSLLTWQVLFRVTNSPDPVVVTLFVVEEDVTGSTRRSVYCDQCRVVGWSGHPVCRKRYHFIIRREESGHAMDGCKGSCSKCGNHSYISEARSRCKCGSSEVTADEDLEDWVHLQLEDHTHLLHGVVHSNGYGHLLTLNGKEGGSKFLSGRDIMDFWDRLCTSLAVRSHFFFFFFSVSYFVSYALFWIEFIK